jgi:hypothetical protein
LFENTFTQSVLFFHPSHMDLFRAKAFTPLFLSL